MELAPAGDLEGLGGVRILHPQGYVGIQLSVEPVPEMAAGHVLAVLAGQRRIVDIKGHGDGGLGDLLEGDGHRILGGTQGIADMKIADAGNGYDGADPGFLDFYAGEAFELVELADLDPALHFGIMVVDDDHFLIDLQQAVVYLAHTDPADVFVVVDGGDQHLGAGLGIAFGGRDIVDNGLEKRLHAGTDPAHIQGGNAGLGGSKDEGALDLFVVGTQVHEQLQDFIDDLGRSCAGPVDLVDADDHGKFQFHGLGKDEPGLGHGAFKGIHHQNDAVDHLQDTFHLSAEIGMAGGVDDVDLYAFIINCCIFT